VFDDLKQDAPFGELRRQIRLQSFLGYDYVRCGLDGLEMPTNMLAVDDTATAAHARGRRVQNEHRNRRPGPRDAQMGEGRILA
jgi:hypothetical protein